MPWEPQPDGTELYVARTPQERWTLVAAKADWDEDPVALEKIDREVRMQERIERLEADRLAQVEAQLVRNAAEQEAMLEHRGNG